MGRGGGRGRGRGRGREGRAEDQYGETFVSQDREDRTAGPARGGGGGGFSGGGEAGGGKKGADIEYVRSVPKFLKNYAHHLAPEDSEKPQRVDTRRQAGGVDEGSGDEREEPDQGEAEALLAAIEDNPDIAKADLELLKRVNQARAQVEKEKGNAAYAAGNYVEAAARFTAALGLEPGNEIFFSNRSAAYAAMKRYEEALRDGHAAVRLRPTWAKAHARVGAALMGLEEFAEATQAYQRAVDIEPEDRSLQESLQKAEISESRSKTEPRGHHKFQRRLPQQQQPPAGGANGRGKPPPGGARDEKPALAAKSEVSVGSETAAKLPRKLPGSPQEAYGRPKKKALLSFTAEEEEGDD